MLDYVFFNDTARDQFVDLVAGIGVEFQLAGGGEEPLSVLVPDDLDEDVWDRLDDYYDALMAEQAREVNAGDEGSVDLVGVQYTHQDGDVAVVRLQPALVNQLTACMSVEELQAMVQVIADEVQAHRKGSMCQVLSSVEN